MGAGPDDALLFYGGCKAAARAYRGGMPAGAAGARHRASACRGVVGRVHGALRALLQSAVVLAEPGRGADGLVDLTALGSLEYANHPMLGSFSACSNITGTLTNTHSIARLLHQHSTIAVAHSRMGRSVALASHGHERGRR